MDIFLYFASFINFHCSVLYSLPSLILIPALHVADGINYEKGKKCIFVFLLIQQWQKILKFSHLQGLAQFHTAVWNYFKNQLQHTQAKCQLCKDIVKHSNNMSNMLKVNSFTAKFLAKGKFYFLINCVVFQD